VLQQNEIDIYSIKTTDKMRRYMNLLLIQINAYYWWSIFYWLVFGQQKNPPSMGIVSARELRP